MATPTEWYTSLQQGGAPIVPPEDRRGGGGGSGGGRGGQFNDFLSKQRALRHAIAKEELRQLKSRGAADRWEDAARRRTPTQTGQTSWQRGPTGRARGRDEHLEKSRADNAAKALLGLGGRMGPMPFEKRDLGTWLNWIGPGRAHQGLMQTGRLLSGGSVGPDVPEEEKSPYSRVVGLPGGTGRWPGGAISGGGLPQREKGGTIPKTGPYELHKGEIVVSADQVDRPLLAALKADKLNKMYSGQMDGKGTGPGPPTAKSMVKDEFRGGTLHGYQGGTMRSILDALMADQKPKADAGQASKDAAWADLARLMMSEGGEGATPGRGPDLGEPPPGFSDDEIAQELIAGGAEGREEESGFFDLPGFEPWKGLPSSAREAGERIRESMPDFGGMAEGARGFWGGLTGAPETPPVAPETLEPEGLGEPAEEAPGMEALLALSPEQEQQDRDRLGAISNEATFARAAGGDRGLGEAGPLTLQRGGPTQRTAYEPGDRADPAVREREKREFNATMNQMKADRLHDYLMKSGPDLDPETFKAIQGQAKQLQAINKAERDRQTLIDESAKDRVTEMEKSVSQYMGQLARAKATGDASTNVGLRQEKQHLRERFSRYELKFWEEAESGASRETMEQMANALIDIEAALEGIEPGDPGYDEWRDANMGYRMGILQE